MADPLSNLSELNGSNGFSINGSGTDSSGNSVSSAGDVNADGIADLIIGAPGNGKSYVVFGSSSGFSTTLDLSNLNGSNGFSINGGVSDFFGGSVSNAGDVNGDGTSDLIIGASGAALGAGKSYVVFGSSNGFSAQLDISNLNGSNGFAINGINGRNSDGVSDSSGKSVSTAGDVNADGISDLIIGASGAASGAGQSYVVFGSSNGFSPTLDLSNLNGSNGFAINGSGTDSSGNSVSSAGDVNGDEISDLIIGAPGNGKSYVVFGNSSGFSASFDLSSLNGSNGFVVNGSATDLSGASVRNGGDVNNDGISDLIIGAYNAASGAGNSYVVFGKSSGFSASLDLSTLDGSNGFAITGINGNDASGYSVSSAGDVNDDGISDLIIGAPFASEFAGQSYVLFGSSNGFSAQLDLSNLDPTKGFAINGINANDSSGISVSAAGDINNDGADDLIIGATGANAGAGSSYVVFGTPQPQPEPEPEPKPQPQVIFNLSTLNGSNGFAINGSGTDSSGNSVSSAGDVNADGIADLIIGAPGNGKSYVVFGSSSGFSTTLDLSTLDGSNGFSINGGVSDFFGGSVSNAGDVNGDGTSDLIIGASGAALGAGKSYVVFGSSNGFSAQLDISNLNGSNGFAINGINGRNSDGVSDSSGKSVSTAGDVNADGISDLIIGASAAASGAGQSYVVFG
ncbi:FG-GAP repeat protein, partial [Desmonostoc muscorum CCALA 125]|nr:FG-GAP repeat protein [Desmonostoc muscorum CCALA 125]